MEKIYLGEVLKVFRGTSLRGNFFSKEGKYIRLTLGNFSYANNGFQENESKDNLFYKKEVPAKFILKKGDIITPLTEQVKGLLGTTAIIPESEKYIQSSDIGLIKVNPTRVLPIFAYYLVSSSLIKKQLSSCAQQTKIRHTSPSAIEGCIAWIPSLRQQQHIVDIK